MTAPDDFCPTNPQARLDTFELISSDGELSGLSEEIGQDFTPMLVQMMAAELVALRERVDNLQTAVDVAGALAAGLLGVDLANLEDSDDPEFAEFRKVLRQRGFEIRQGALT
jgi:hypothetical protein